MSEITTYDIGGVQWHVLCRAFPSDRDAERAFFRLHSRASCSDSQPKASTPAPSESRTDD